MMQPGPFESLADKAVIGREMWEQVTVFFFLKMGENGLLKCKWGGCGREGELKYQGQTRMDY